MKQDILKEEIYEELNAKKNKLELDLIESGRDKTTKIQDIKRIGTIKLQDKETKEEQEISLYAVEELDIHSDRVTIKYYAENELIGIEKDGQIAINAALELSLEEAQAIRDNIENAKAINEEAINNKELKEAEGLYSLNELEEEKEEKYAKITGVDKEKVKGIAEIKSEEADKEQHQEGEELDTKKVEKLSNLQEVKASTKVNNYKDMEQALGMQGVAKFVIVYSEDAAKVSEKGRRNSSRYSMIAIMKDGTSISMDDKLEPNTAAGMNTNEGRIQTDADGYTREETGEASMYKIKGTNKNFSFELGQYGEMQVYYGEMTKGIGGNKGNVFNGTQIETSNVKRVTSDIRALEDPYEGQYYADKGTKETKEHLEHGDEKVTIENSDGKDNTQEECENIYETQIPGLSFKMTWRNLADSTKIPLEKIIEKFNEKIDDGISPDNAVLAMQKESQDDPDIDNDSNEERTKKNSVDREPGDTINMDKVLGPKH